VKREYDPVYWAQHVAKIQLPKTTGGLNFKDHPFMKDVYRDVGGEVVIIKGAQLGFSTMSITRSLWAATKFPISVIYCVDEETELLSRKGWKRWNEVEVGEEILTFDTTTETTRWSIVEELFARAYSGPMVRFEGANIDALVTPNHRWAVKPLHGSRWHFVETKDLKNYQRIPLRSEHAGFPSTAIYTDDFVELAGWVVTEGHYRHYSLGETLIVISQNPGPNADKIRTLLGRVESVSRRGVVGFKEQQHSGRSILRFLIDGPIAAQIRAIFPTKELTPDFVASLTERQLRLLFETMMAGDGHARVSHKIFTQKSKATTDAFAMMTFLLGYGVRTVPRVRGRFEWADTFAKSDKYVQTEKILNYATEYTGIIWCPRSRDQTFVMRRNGKVFGISQHLPVGSLLMAT
jgi:hypothetical protein